MKNSLSNKSMLFFYKNFMKIELQCFLQIAYWKIVGYIDEILCAGGNLYTT